MSFRLFALPTAATVILIGLGLTGCSSPVVKAPSDGTGGATTSPPPDGGGSLCCPPDPTPGAGCLHLGGAGAPQCGATCDFWCSTNWRLEKDEADCDVWRWDIRPPAPGEDNLCLPERDAAADADASPDADAPFCCPIDPAPTSCAHLGGVSVGSFGCGTVCDFWCSYNWRVEKDPSGCDVWRMDYRMPAPGENDLCFPDGDGGADAHDGQADGG